MKTAAEFAATLRAAERCDARTPHLHRRHRHARAVLETRLLELLDADRAAEDQEPSLFGEGEGSAGASCDGHPAGPFDPMGVTVFCDGSCRP